MKKLLPILCLFGCLYSFSQKVVFIIADGIPADVLEKAITPNLNQISNIGTYTRSYVGGEKSGYSQTPTISAVSYNSLLTGTWVNKHNVWGNDIKEPNYHYPTIFRLFKDQFPQKKIAVFSSWLDNRTKLVGDGLEATNKIKVTISADGFEKDTLRFPHDKASHYMHLIDEQVINDADASIRKEAPDLSWIYLEYTDDIGHKYGDSPEQMDAVAKLDNQIGRIWKAIEYRQKMFKEKWMIIVTTDHGRTETDGKGHGTQTPRQRSTWMVSNVKFNTYAKVEYPAIVDILPTMAAHLQIKIPQQVSRELDGIPLTGKVSLAQPKLNIFQHKADISWQVLDTTGTAKIWLCTTNQYKTGGSDEYKLLNEVPLQQAHTTIDLSNYPSDFYKIVIEGKYNMVNRWWVKEKMGN